MLHGADLHAFQGSAPWPDGAGSEAGAYTHAEPAPRPLHAILLIDEVYLIYMLCSMCTLHSVYTFLLWPFFLASAHELFCQILCILLIHSVYAHVYILLMLAFLLLFRACSLIAHAALLSTHCLAFCRGSSALSRVLPPSRALGAPFSSSHGSSCLVRDAATGPSS